MEIIMTQLLKFLLMIAVTEYEKQIKKSYLSEILNLTPANLSVAIPNPL